MKNEKFMVVSVEGYQLFGPKDMKDCQRYIDRARDSGVNVDGMKIIPLGT